MADCLSGCLIAFVHLALVFTENRFTVRQTHAQNILYELNGICCGTGGEKVFFQLNVPKQKLYLIKSTSPKIWTRDECK